MGLRLALSDVHGISAAEVARIEDGQPYTSLLDFWQRARARANPPPNGWPRSARWTRSTTPDEAGRGRGVPGGGDSRRPGVTCWPASGFSTAARAPPAPVRGVLATFHAFRARKSPKGTLKRTIRVKSGKRAGQRGRAGCG